MKFIVPVLLFLVLNFPVYGQILEENVVSSSSGCIESAEAFFAWTIGECSIETYEDSEIKELNNLCDEATPGNKSQDNLSGNQVKFTGFPNPANQFIDIKISGLNEIPKNCFIEIYDLMGLILLKKEIKSFEMKLYIGHIKQKSIFMRLSQNGNLLGSMVINKTN